MIPGFDLYTFLATQCDTTRGVIKLSVYRSAYRGAPVNLRDQMIDAALVWIGQLNAIRVLYRRPDTLTLYGIPYEMAPGQAPRDIWEGPMFNPDHPMRKAVVPAHQKFAPPVDWIWLSELTGRAAMRQGITDAWLTAHKAEIPEHPHEWCRVVYSTADQAAAL